EEAGVAAQRAVRAVRRTVIEDRGRGELGGVDSALDRGDPLLVRQLRHPLLAERPHDRHRDASDDGHDGNGHREYAYEAIRVDTEHRRSLLSSRALRSPRFHRVVRGAPVRRLPESSPPWRASVKPMTAVLPPNPH